MKLKNKKNENGNKESCENLCNLVVRKRKMLKDERGQLSIDFLVGISLFILALLFMAHFIPGMFVPFQTETIDLNSVAYRTSVILVEDPGWWDSGTGTDYGEDWDTKEHIGSVSRVGLAIDKEHPNLLKWSKIEGFKNCTDLTDKLGLYRMIGGNPIDYGYNITIVNSSKYILATMGDSVPEYGDVASMKRIVWMRLPPVANICNESLEGSDSPSKALFYIDGADIKGGILEDGILLAVTNFTITNPSKSTYKGIQMSNNVHPSDNGYQLTGGTGDFNDDGGYVSLLDNESGNYTFKELPLKTDLVIKDKNDTLEIFLARSVFDNQSDAGKINMYEDIFIELQFDNGITINPSENYPPGTYLKPLLVTDYESRRLIIKVWQ